MVKAFLTKKKKNLEFLKTSVLFLGSLDVKRFRNKLILKTRAMVEVHPLFTYVSYKRIY